MPIDKTQAAADYKAGASNAGDKLVRNYTNTPGKLAKAASPAAQDAYKAAMSDPKVLARRQNNLSKLSEQDLNAAMEAKGATAYNNAVANSDQKWLKNVTPSLDVIDRVMPTLKPRTRDVNANIDNRLKPLANALRAAKDAKA